VLPTIITQALTQSRISIGSITPRRDFTFVLDTVKGFIKAATSDKAVGQIINLGTGRDYSIGEAIKIVGELLNKKLTLNVRQERIRPEKSEVMRLCASNRKAKELLDWEPEYSFKEGLKEMIKFIRKHIDRYESKKYVI